MVKCMNKDEYERGWRIRGGESISRGAHLSDHNQEPAPVAIIIPLWVLVPRRMLTYCSCNYRTFRMTHIRFCLGCMHNWRICSSRVDLELEAAATHFCWQQQRLVFAWTWSIPPPHIPVSRGQGRQIGMRNGSPFYWLILSILFPDYIYCLYIQIQSDRQT